MGGWSRWWSSRLPSRMTYRQLLAKYPELLDGEQVRPDNPRRWILISREMGIAERSEESPRWSLDHLIVDQDAVPTLVEVKRSANTEIRRTIVGQLLEYAAHASETWTADTMRARFEASCEEFGDNPTASAWRGYCRPTMRTWMLSSRRSPPTSQPVACGYCLWPTRSRTRSCASLSSSISKCPQSRCWPSKSSSTAGRRAAPLVPRVMGRIAGTIVKNPGGPRFRYTRETFLAAFQGNVDREVAARNCSERCAEDAASTSVLGRHLASAFVQYAAHCGGRTSHVTVAVVDTPRNARVGWPRKGLTNVHLGEAISSIQRPVGT